MTRPRVKRDAADVAARANAPRPPDWLRVCVVPAVVRGDTGLNRAARPCAGCLRLGLTAVCGAAQRPHACAPAASTATSCNCSRSRCKNHGRACPVAGHGAGVRGRTARCRGQALAACGGAAAGAACCRTGALRSHECSRSARPVADTRPDACRHHCRAHGVRLAASR